MALLIVALIATCVIMHGTVGTMLVCLDYLVYCIWEVFSTLLADSGPVATCLFAFN